MEWYYADASDNQVSVDESQLPELVASLTIKPTTLVWNESMTEWKPCAEVRPDLFGSTPTPPPFSQSQPPATPPAHSAQSVPTAPGAPVVRTSTTDGTAVCSLVFGIIGLLCAFGCMPVLFSIPAIICGHIARKKVKAGDSAPNNGGLALGGLITGYIGLVIGLIMTSIIIIAMVMDSQGLLE